MTTDISFPFFHKNLTVNKVFARVFNVDIYWYSLLIVLSFIFGYYIVRFVLRRKKEVVPEKYNDFGFDNILEIIVGIIPVSFICARLYYVIFNLDYYLVNIKEIINIRSGGLAIYGGLIGGLIYLYFYAKIRNIKLLDLLDIIVIAVPFGQMLGRWGNFFNVEAYGNQTNFFLRMGIHLKDGSYIEVHPTFLYESIGSLLIFLFLIYLNEVINDKIKENKDNNKDYTGIITYSYLFLYGLLRSIVEPLRSDSLMLGNFKISFVLSVILFIVFGSLLFYKYMKLNIIKKEKN